MDRRPWPARSVLAALAPEQRRELLGAGRIRHFAAEQVLLRQGERSRHVDVLVDGVTKVTSNSDNGREVLLAIRSRGDLVGELAGLDGGPRIATVTATGPVTAVVLTHQEFEAFQLRHPRAATAVSTSIANKFRSTTQRVVDYSAHDAPARLVRVLYRLFHVYGRDTGDRLELGIPITQPELASIVGASEAAVHKALADLRRRGVVTTGYRSTAIRSLAALADAGGIPHAERG